VDKKIAILLDCENTSHKYVSDALNKLSKHGDVVVRHAHGNWNQPCLNIWKDKLLTHAIKPILHHAHIAGKNSSDMALIVDAMDLLHSGCVDAFALMSSDSDFTSLILRIRENGLPVYCFGTSKASKILQESCTVFYTMCEPPKPTVKKPTVKKATVKKPTVKKATVKKPTVKKPTVKKATVKKATVKKATVKKPTVKKAIPENTIVFFQKRISRVAESDGWASMQKLNENIKSESNFDIRKHGYKRAIDLLRACPDFRVLVRKDKRIYVKKM